MKSLEELVASNPCRRCSLAGYPPPCRCGGGGGPGGDGGDSKDKKTEKNEITEGLSRTQVTEIINRIAEEWVNLLKPRAGIVDFESGLLNIHSDNLHGVFVLTPKPGLTNAKKIRRR